MVRPRFIAAEVGHLEIVTVLLGHDGIDANEGGRFSQTALHWAAGNGDAEIVTALLRHVGIDVNKGNTDGQTPLHLAAVGPKIPPRVLFDGTIDRSGRCWTALHWAAKERHAKIVTALLGHDGIDASKADRYGQTALHCAAEYGNAEIVSALLRQVGINANEADKVAKQIDAGFVARQQLRCSSPSRMIIPRS